MLHLDPHGVTAVHAHIGNERRGSQVLAISTKPFNQGRKHSRALRSLASSRITRNHSRCARVAKRDTEGKELAMRVELLRGERQRRIHQTVEVILRLL
jgi:hypothetical protein